MPPTPHPGATRLVVHLVIGVLLCALTTSTGATTAYAGQPGPTVVTRVAGWSARPLQVRAGSSTVFRVRVVNRVGRSGRPVVLQRRAVSGGRWTTAARATTGPLGRARLAWTAPAATSRVRLRLRVPPQGRARGLVTPARLVTVRRGAPDDGDPEVDERVSEVLALVNRARATARSCGGQHYPAVPALRLDRRLGEAAGDYAHRMATEDFFDHTSPDGDDAGDRMTAVGYDWHAWGENIAAGQDTAADVVEDWLGSAGHCSNIMSKVFADIGIGVATDAGSAYGTYWVQDFGHP